MKEIYVMKLILSFKVINHTYSQRYRKKLINKIWKSKNKYRNSKFQLKKEWEVNSKFINIIIFLKYFSGKIWLSRLNF